MSHANNTASGSVFLESGFLGGLAGLARRDAIGGEIAMMIRENPKHVPVATNQMTDPLTMPARLRVTLDRLEAAEATESARAARANSSGARRAPAPAEAEDSPGF